MKLVVALLAAACALCGCGGGAEPGASREATVVLDFTPNAVHSGLYAAVDLGAFTDEGVQLRIREPGETSDGARLVAAGRAEFAVIDINDLATANQRGLDLVAIGALVQVPLASVITADRDAVEHPRDLEGLDVGVTGLPSDDAVLDAIVASDGADPETVERTTIGFDSVAALSGGEVDAATAFWNAEGVALRDLGVPTREFRLGDLASEPFPELVVVANRDLVASEPDLVAAFRTGLERGSEVAAEQPDEALDALISQVEGLDERVQRLQMDALRQADAFADGAEPGTISPERFRAWLRFARENGLDGSLSADQARRLVEPPLQPAP